MPGNVIRAASSPADSSPQITIRRASRSSNRSSDITPRVVRSAGRSDTAAPEHQAEGPLRVRGGEQGCQGSPVVVPDHEGPFGSDRVEDCPEVVEPRLDRRDRPTAGPTGRRPACRTGSPAPTSSSLRRSARTPAAPRTPRRATRTRARTRDRSGPRRRPGRRSRRRRRWSRTSSWAGPCGHPRRGRRARQALSEARERPQNIAQACPPRASPSGRADSNRRPPAPKAGALPGCATPRGMDASALARRKRFRRTCSDR